MEQPEIQPAPTSEAAQVVEVKILTTEQVIESAKAELRAVHPVEQVLALVAESANLSIAGIADQIGISTVDTARKKLKGVRTAIERKRKELKQVALDYGKAVDATAKELAAPIETEEARLAAMLDDIERQRKEAEEAEARALLLKIEERTNELFGLGYAFAGTYYQLGSVKISPDRIKTATDEEWPNIIERSKAEAKRLADEQAARDAEAARQKQIEEENARLRAELEALRAAQAAQAATVKTSPTPAPQPTPDPLKPNPKPYMQNGQWVYVNPDSGQVELWEGVVPVQAQPAPKQTTSDAPKQTTSDAPKQSVSSNANSAPVSTPTEQPKQQQAAPEQATAPRDPKADYLASLLEKTPADVQKYVRAAFNHGILYAKTETLRIFDTPSEYPSRAAVRGAIEKI